MKRSVRLPKKTLKSMRIDDGDTVFIKSEDASQDDISKIEKAVTKAFKGREVNFIVTNFSLEPRKFRFKKGDVLLLNTGQMTKKESEESKKVFESVLKPQGVEVFMSNHDFRPRKRVLHIGIS